MVDRHGRDREMRRQIELYAIPKTADDYRDRKLVEELTRVLSNFRKTMRPSEWHGFSIDARTLKDFDKAAEGLVGVVSRAGVLFAPARQQARLAQIEAQADEPLQAFLARVTV